MAKIKFLFLSILISLPHTLFPAEKPTFILISFDGFRWDYTERGLTPNLDFMAQNGVKASSLKPTYPSKTFPNHLSIVTGMHTENHGIIYNDINDPFSGKEYRIGSDPANRDSRWYQGEAIWETLRRQGVRTASYFWPGSEIEMAERHPDIFEHYDHNLPYETRIDGVIEWLQLPVGTRPDFITLYFHETDSYGHGFGPASPQINRAIARLDLMLGRLFTGLKKIDQFEQTNIVVVSDHGMTAIGEKRVVRVDKFLADEKYEVMGYGPMIGIRPVESRIEQVYHNLKKQEFHFKVYKREDVPIWFHYSNHPFIPPLILIAEMGWTLTTEPVRNMGKGNHGYDNHHLDMHAVFHAMGPAFKKGYTTGTLNNIDIYPLICRIFEVMPRQNIDGRLDRIGFILKEEN
ncbi:MAG: alkaline phosphatase family protein [Calditrichaeota bacterium]|nr:MAG: alkaline phosphatase family protein [Calditrichota bacterium]